VEEPTTDNNGAFAVSICGLLRTRGVAANMRGPKPAGAFVVYRPTGVSDG